MTQLNLSKKQRQNQGQREQTGGWVREGCSGSLGLSDANWYIQDG